MTKTVPAMLSCLAQASPSRPYGTNGVMRLGKALRLTAVPRLAAVACLLLFFLFFGRQAQAAEHVLTVSPPTPTVSHDILNLDLSVQVSNEDGLAALLKDGASLSLGISLRLERTRSWWTNEVMAEKNYACPLRHDPLTREFSTVIPAPDGERVLKDKNLTRLLLAWRKLSLPLAPAVLAPKTGEESYIIEVQISLRHAEAPPWLEKNLMFWTPDLARKVTLSVPYRGK